MILTTQASDFLHNIPLLKLTDHHQANLEKLILEQEVFEVTASQFAIIKLLPPPLPHIW